MSLAFKKFLEQLELFLGRQPFEIHYCNCRRAVRLAPQKFFVRSQQHVQQVAAAKLRSYFENLTESFHHRQGRENLNRDIGVGDSGRTFAVQFNETVSALREKGIKSC